MPSPKLAEGSSSRNYSQRSRDAFAGRRIAINLLVAALGLSVWSLQAQTETQVQALYTEAKAAQASGDLTGAIAKYQQLVHIAPRLAAGYNNLGMLYERTHQYPKAIDALKHARALDPSLPSVPALLGIAYFGAGDYASAKSSLETALKANPNDTHAALLLARTLLRAGDIEAASRQLQDLAKREPNDQEIWYQLGQAYMQLSQKAFTKVQAINPDSVLVHEMSGQMMEDMLNYDGALVEYKKAVEIAPHEPGTHYGLGMVYWNQNNLDAALGEFRQELDNDPSNCEAHAKVANILLQQQQHDAALTESDAALSICPTLLQARVVRGGALVRLGRNAEAIVVLHDVATTNPEDQNVHFYLAQAYRATGDQQAQAKELEIYRKLEAAAREHTTREAQEVIHAKEPAQ